MTDKEYAEFMSYLFERYIRPRLPRLRRRMFHHMEHEFHYHLDQAERSARLLGVRITHSQRDAGI